MICDKYLCSGPTLESSIYSFRILQFVMVLRISYTKQWVFGHSSNVVLDDQRLFRRHIAKRVLWSQILKTYWVGQWLIISLFIRNIINQPRSLFVHAPIKTHPIRYSIYGNKGNPGCNTYWISDWLLPSVIGWVQNTNWESIKETRFRLMLRLRT